MLYVTVFWKKKKCECACVGACVCCCIVCTDAVRRLILNWFGPASSL